MVLPKLTQGRLEKTLKTLCFEIGKEGEIFKSVAYLLKIRCLKILSDA